MNTDLERLRRIKNFPSLLKYLKEELDWPIEKDSDVEDLTFDYQPDELGLDPKTAVKIKEIKQLRPFVTNQPWGIFYINFEPKQLPIVALRRILSKLVIKKRASGNKAQQATWQLNDLLFISSYGESDERAISFAHFSEDKVFGDLPTLRVLGWDSQDTVLHLEHAHETLREKLRWPENEDKFDDWRKTWSSAFTLRPRQVIRTSRDLALKLADLAIDIRKRANSVLAIESEKGPLRTLYKAFQEALIHDLSEDDFADMYAQTIAYGLLSAYFMRPSGIVADNLVDIIHYNTNPFLKETLSQFLTVGGRRKQLDFDELGINEVIELLRNSDLEAVKRDFGDRRPNEDPAIHFYELFLKEYDPDKRVKRGVFYTPIPVVKFIVRSVDEILRSEFGLEDGLADTTTWGEMTKRNAGLAIPEGVRADEPFVQILDPATGTGTFLVEVIENIHATMMAKWEKQRKSKDEVYELWNEYVQHHLLPRVHGFELMMAPYAIAHMKIGLKLRETHYSFLSSERARIYLTNTLEEPVDFASYLEQMAPALAHEAAAANEIKRKTITVIVGNPPYSVAAGGGTPMANRLMREYTEGMGVERERKKGALQDDYLRFIRYADSRIRDSGIGIVGMITNNSYIDGTLHRAMRHVLACEFHPVRVINLHGSGRAQQESTQADENVFDILQGVAIMLLVRAASGRPSDRLVIQYSSLLGSRQDKYEKLRSSRFDFEPVYPAEPYALFRPINAEILGTYQQYPSVRELFPIGSSGIETEKDSFAVAFEPNALKSRLRNFADPSVSDDDAAKKFGLSDTPNWSIKESRLSLRKNGIKDRLLIRYLFHVFDWRMTYYSDEIITRPRRKVMNHMLQDNLSIITLRQVKGEPFAHIVATRSIANKFVLSSKSSNVSYQFPLYFYEFLPTTQDSLVPKRRQANLSSQIVKWLSGKLGLSFREDHDADSSLRAEDIFHYSYAVLFAPYYRLLYADYLTLDFPRIPFTSCVELFRGLSALGADLVALHLLEDDYEAASWNASQPKGKSPFKTPITRFPGKGEAEVTKSYPKYKDDNVYINPSRSFEGVPEEVWNFRVGGYQVCEKWLKDRRGRTLSDEDINHYQRVVVALSETIRLMAEIDRVIEEHGGWPLVGSQDTPKTESSGGLPFE